MSQIDKLTFTPHVFWFIVLFIILYFILFSYILPLIYQSLKIRKLFFLNILFNNFFINNFFIIFLNVNNSLSSKIVFKSLLLCLAYYKHIYNFRFQFYLKTLQCSTFYI